ncbi:MAG: MarP family serine protease [Acidimicrobiia bacterium]
MNTFDLVVLAMVAAGAVVGFRVGFLIRAFSWLGLSLGVVLGLRLMPRVAHAMPGATPGVRLLAVAALLMGLALVGHTIGLVASAGLRNRLARSGAASALDRLAGGLLGAVGGVVLLWLLVPAMRSTPGWPARAARDSALVAVVDRYAPDQPNAARVLGRIVGEAPYPMINGDSTNTGRPPTTDAGPQVDARGAQSVVLVVGDACGLRLSGTGFAVAPDLVVTNAHVVAGEERTEIVTAAGRRLNALVVTFDGRHDVAVLRVRGLNLPPLPLGPTVTGTIATVLGHPGGGDLRATPARVARRIDIPRTDITRTGTIRTVIVGLAARLIPGDSGAPVIGADGLVQAMVFAVDPARDTTAFALSSEEVTPFVTAAANASSAISTGSCLND